MHQKSIRFPWLACALLCALAFVAACSGTASPIAPSAASSARSAAVDTPEEPPCDPTKETCEPPPCDPTKEICEPPPPPPGDDGCTPGYWKNHLDSWPPTGYTTGTTLQSVFGANALAGSLLAGLDFGGGSGITGAKQILLRAAVAALLNAAHPDVDYTRTTAQVIASVQAALASNSRDTMLTLASALDADNNLGCPIN